MIERGGSLVKTAALGIGLVALTGSAFGQAMIERGAAAITGSTAGVGIGKNIGNILKNVEKATAAAANGPSGTSGNSWSIPTGKPFPTPLINANTPISTGIMKAMGSTYTPKRMIGPEPAPAPVPVAALAPVVPDPAPLPSFNLEAMQEVKEGLSRDDLVAKVGVPFFKLTLPDGNHAVEIYRYRSNGQDAAVVKLLDGVITSVEMLSR